MPDINADGCTIHVEVEGPERAPVLMLSNSLGTNLHMWDEQVAPFTRHFRLVRFDRRGHGKSAVPKGPYSMERLGRDVLAVLDGLGIEKINWCGLSMGGMEGMWLGANAASRIDKLILSNTASYFPDKDNMEWPHQARARKGTAGHRRRQYGALVHEGIPRTLAADAGAHSRDVPSHRGRRLCRLRRGDPRHGSPPAARRRSRRRRWSSPAAMIPLRRSKPANSLLSTFPAPSSRCSMPRTLPIWSSRKPTPTRCWDFC